VISRFKTRVYALERRLCAETVSLTDLLIGGGSYERMRGPCGLTRGGQSGRGAAKSDAVVGLVIRADNSPSRVLWLHRLGMDRAGSAA
jgi:hypothetical protein